MDCAMLSGEQVCCRTCLMSSDDVVMHHISHTSNCSHHTIIGHNRSRIRRKHSLPINRLLQSQLYNSTVMSLWIVFITSFTTNSGLVKPSFAFLHQQQHRYISITTTTNVKKFTPSSIILQPSFLQLDREYSSHLTLLNNVRKRKGDFITSSPTKLKEGAQRAKALVSDMNAVPIIPSTTTAKQYLSDRSQKEQQQQPITVTSGRNIFQHFTPKYEIGEYDTLTTIVPTERVIESSTSESVNREIVRLLSDDDGEEDLHTPDYSEEAANQIADKALYSRISEEAKFKANIAVQKKSLLSTTTTTTTTTTRSLRVVEPDEYPDDYMEEDDDYSHEYNTSEESSNSLTTSDSWSLVHSTRKATMKVRASVKETGQDMMSQYVKSMGQHELLPKASEILLGRQIQILNKWEMVRQELEEAQSKPPTFAAWADALDISVPELKKQIRRSQRAKAALIEANLRLVVTVARQAVKKGRSEINFQDACQEGIIGLTRACEKFDPEQGCRFSTYAVWWIKREVHKSVTQQSRTVRLPASAMKKINDIRINERLLINSLGRKPSDQEVADKCQLTVEKLLFYRKAAIDATSLDKKIVAKVGKGSNSTGGSSGEGKTVESMVKDSSPTPADIANKEMLQNDVRRLIKTLSPREQAVIRLRFGLDDGTPRTLDYIGKKFSVEKERIRKIEAKALLKLRQPYRNQSVKCYISEL